MSTYTDDKSYDQKAMERWNEPVVIPPGEEPSKTALATMPRADIGAVFAQYENQYAPVVAEARSLTITAAHTPAERAALSLRAVALRKLFSASRIAAEKKRKEMKEGVIAEGKKIDEAAGKIEDACKAIELHLLAQEKFEEREALRLEDETRRRREAELRPLMDGHLMPMYDYGKLTEDEYQHVHSQQKELHELREDKKRRDAAEATKRADDEEKARKQVIEDNKRLLADAAKRDEVDKERRRLEGELRTARVREINPYLDGEPLVADVALMNAEEWATFLDRIKGLHAEREAVRAETRRKIALGQERATELQVYWPGTVPNPPGLGELSDTAWLELLEEAKARHAANEVRKAEQVAEQARKDKEAAANAIALKKLQDAEAERQREQQQAREEEETQLRAAALAERQAAAAPDAEKLKALLKSLPLAPSLANVKASDMMFSAMSDFTDEIKAIITALEGGSL